MDFAQLLKDFGPILGIVLFFIWRDWKREENLVERVQKLEDFTTKVLSDMVKEQSSVIAINTEVIKANTEQIKRITTTLSLCELRNK